ncbi:MAG: sugar phosphate nucleotidyltransferase [Bradymonadales bacterium]|jgi:UTP--glucose-1-phosphate uridylyltransferase
MTNSPVEVAVIPVAGRGTRWLPITRTVAKELLPVWRRTSASYALEEAIKAGCKEIIFVIGPEKSDVFGHFLRFDSSDLSAEFQDHSYGKLHDEVKLMACVQDKPRGLGDAVLCAQALVGNRNFAVLLPDEVLMQNGTALLCKRVPSILLMEVDYEQRRQYGMVKAEPYSDAVLRLVDLVEKPEPSLAPSSLAVTGRYCLSPVIFDYLKTQSPGKNDEIQLTDALRRFSAEHELYGIVYEGTRHDVGQPLGLLTASIEFALRDPDSSQQVRRACEELLRRVEQKPNYEY